MPNPWDLGMARLFASLGFEALATTSSGYAATLGRFDGRITRDEAIEHARAIAEESDLPVNADLENGFGDTPEDAAETVRLATRAGMAGCSIEDCSNDGELRIYDAALAAERVAAAAEAAHATVGAAESLVLTARAENFLRGNPDLADTISRAQAFQEAGADVVYAPGLVAIGDIEQLVSSVDVPVNVLIWPAGPTIEELASAGVARVSVGGGFSLLSFGAVARAAKDLLVDGTHGFWDLAAEGRAAREKAFR
jgi:2-methylisocitrate lyase-like PEP mutase family enzyme